MLRRIVTVIILVPLGVIIVGFAVTNRQAVTISFDPFSTTSPAYALTVPLFAIIFVALILGVLLGGFASWLGQGKWRRAARRLDADFQDVRDELHALRQHLSASEPRQYQANVESPRVIPPPAS